MKDHWVQIPDPGTYPLAVNPIVDGAFLPKTLIDGCSSLNIIFTETLRKMDFNFNKMTACNEPFYGVVAGKAAYPIGRVCLPVTFGTKENTEYLTFKVTDFRSSYHAILGRPMLAKFMAISSSHLPHHEDASAKRNSLCPRGHHGLLQLRKRYSRALQRLRD
jgi:hypothetical protein